MEIDIIRLGTEEEAVLAASELVTQLRAKLRQELEHSPTYRDLGIAEGQFRDLISRIASKNASLTSVDDAPPDSPPELENLHPPGALPEAFQSLGIPRKSGNAAASEQSSPPDVLNGNTESRVLEFLEAHSGEGFSAKQVHMGLGGLGALKTIRKSLYSLAKDGRVERFNERGTYGVIPTPRC